MGTRPGDGDGLNQKPVCKPCIPDCRGGVTVLRSLEMDHVTNRYARERPPMSYTLSEAAKATGKSKMTLLRAIKNGRMSARRKDDNSYEIDPAELHRVFPPVSECDGDTDNTLRPDMPEDTSLLRLKLESALEKIEALDTERERERRDAQATIDDLRRRLDQEAEERRRLTLMLTDQRERQPTAPQEAVQGRFARAWEIIRGKG